MSPANRPACAGLATQFAATVTLPGVRRSACLLLLFVTMLQRAPSRRKTNRTPAERGPLWSGLVGGVIAPLFVTCVWRRQELRPRKLPMPIARIIVAARTTNKVRRVLDFRLGRGGSGCIDGVGVVLRPPGMATS